MIYRYSQEAKERISALGHSAISEFIDEIPLKLRTTVYARLPRIQGGFRAGTPAELKAKQIRLIGHLLNHSQAGRSSTSDWESFATLWRAWATSRLGEGIPEGNDSEPDTEAGITFFEGLADHFKDASREDIERLFTFSGFPNHPAVVKAINRFSPAAVLARNRMIDALPGRVEKVEDRLTDAEKMAVKFAAHIDQLEASAVSFNVGLGEAAESLDSASKAIGDIRTQVDAVAAQHNRLESSVEACGHTVKHAAADLSALATRAEVLEDSLRVLSARGEAWDRLVAEVAGLKGAVEALSAREAALAEVTGKIEGLAERVGAIESVLSGGGVGIGSQQRVRLLETRPEEPFVEIVSVEDALDAVSSNLQAVGIVRSAADIAAREVVAALVAGQLVQFSGSLADLLADACAAAVGGPIYHEWRVPVGLTSDDAAAECVDMVAETSGCLLLKGANLSAFEVYGGAVRDLVTRRQFAASGGSRLALVASWTQGPAVFSNGGTLAELGPVLDSDILPMRGISAKLPSMVFGRLAHGSWLEIEGFTPDISALSVNALTEILKEAGFDGGSLWKRVTKRACAILRAIPGGTEERDLHSLMVSWALPWAKATGGPADEISRIAARELTDRRANAEA